MLVLSRKKNESIVINDNITVVIVDVRGDKVRLGVDAPSSVTVHRKEVFDAISRESTDDVVNIHGNGKLPVLEAEGPLSMVVSHSNSGSTAILEPEIEVAVSLEGDPAFAPHFHARTKPIAKKTIKKK